MTAPRDKLGRPIVVVTGMGIVTSLGAGKTDNWAKLTATKSGIRTVTRFSIDGLKTTMAETVSLLTLEHLRIQPTINYENPDPAIPFDEVGNKARDAKVTAVMSNSFGFSGQSASLVLTREPP